FFADRTGRCEGLISLGVSRRRAVWRIQRLDRPDSAQLLGGLLARADVPRQFRSGYLELEQLQQRSGGSATGAQYRWQRCCFDFESRSGECSRQQWQGTDSESFRGRERAGSVYFGKSVDD